jgi:hypothetical protein
MDCQRENTTTVGCYMAGDLFVKKLIPKKLNF